MTLGEAEMRYQIRGDALSSIYARKTAETLNPLIIRSYNILFDMGLLGITEGDKATANLLRAEGIEPLIIPEAIARAIANGKKIYDIDYISPAAHVMREEEYRGVITTANNAMQMAAVDEMSIHKLNTDKFLEYSQELTGAPLDLLRSNDEAKKIRENIAKARAAETQVAMQKEQAGTLKDVETAKNISAGG